MFIVDYKSLCMLSGTVFATVVIIKSLLNENLFE